MQQCRIGAFLHWCILAFDNEGSAGVAQVVRAGVS
jgi:hypothetical protein